MPEYINVGPGIFNDQRPIWIQEYSKYVKKFGKNKANAIYPGVLNWITSQKMLGKNARIKYNSNTTRSSSSTNRSNRKTRRRR